MEQTPASRSEQGSTLKNDRKGNREEPCQSRSLVSPWPKSARLWRRTIDLFRLPVLLLGLSAISMAQTLAFTEYPISVASVPTDLTAGPDGALWYPSSLSAIGRITTSGMVTNYPTPTSNSGPQGIAAGPDGAIWFAEALGGKIGRVTSSGAIVEYEIPTPISGLQGITAGPDGALWFTERNVAKIGRITTAGTVTEYPTLTPNSQPSGITAGSDGAIWFVEFQAEKIGRITLGGAITEYALPTALYNPYKITAGPDGALWFTGGPFSSTLGRITTKGVVSFDNSQFATRQRVFRHWRHHRLARRRGVVYSVHDVPRRHDVVDGLNQWKSH
jgi:streptogramin lyase